MVAIFHGELIQNVFNEKIREYQTGIKNLSCATIISWTPEQLLEQASFYANTCVMPSDSVPTVDINKIDKLVDDDQTIYWRIKFTGNPLFFKYSCSGCVMFQSVRSIQGTYFEILVKPPKSTLQLDHAEQRAQQDLDNIVSSLEKMREFVKTHFSFLALRDGFQQSLSERIKTCQAAIPNGYSRG